MVRAALVTATSLALTGAVVVHAYLLKHQFYPTVVYLTKSSPSMAVLYIQAFVLVFLLGKFMRKVFFGQLRAAEMEHLIERSWYAVTETCLAFTVFRDDFSPRFVALFTLLLFLKCFHWLAEDRVDFMERSPNISWVFHLRVLSLLGLLAAMDFLFVNHACHSIITRGASVQLVFGFEYAILLTMILTTFIKYILHTVDLQSENPWDNKAVYMLYTELFTGFIKVLLYIAFMTIMIKVHTFPLFAIRPMYLAMRQFKKAVTDAIMSRRAIRNMNTLYPDATPEDLQASDNVCIICREEMVTGAKKLPCNHIFHSSCLRSWFQRQQTCPTCRMDVLRATNNNQTQAPAAQAPAPAPAAPANAPAAAPVPNVAPGMLPGFPPGIFPFWGPFPAVPPPAAAAPAPAPGAADAPQSSTEATQAAGTSQSASSSTTDTTTSSSAAAAPGSAIPGFPFSFPPPPFPTAPWLPMPPPFVSSMPPPPPSLSRLSDEELRELEAEGRRGLEARLQCLQNIHTLLDAAMLNIHHYLSTVATLNPPRPESSARETSATNHSASSPTAATNTEKDTSISDEASGATVSSQPADSTSCASDTERKENLDEEALEDEGGEPSAAELRRRRLRKLETASSSSSSPPPDN
ncbi:E3 ubiquitin-protein ligase synoviolin [Kryptolebias marmoratus]|uniref:RING-type E3 ubiquitin transferase n=1 Tax=Kryptolebias marmoratus TaxID=37003 RepID=A0A3Q3F405_KRYMA|nr:E3 ubiquitin-protein ligase synoviolin [Kryptolebias marmoratus]XP_017295788.1 E3 ubiquitin-protein ligase synoviolin [Kryptolebias marmoratus]XP_017295790.1 E3 ubiquitin-protein ligase synoviolin [Kryptolebias marmoratus]XP_017295791.1 E3 ubiquitin-protein ligase synoviolin [Kryptolebias marmoratus]